MEQQTEYQAKIKAKATTPNNAKRIFNMLQRLADNVTENDLLTFCEKVEKDKDFFAKIVSKLNNPLVQKFF